MSRPFFFGGPQPAQQASPYLVSFKAGKLTKATNSNTVSGKEIIVGNVFHLLTFGTTR